MARYYLTISFLLILHAHTDCFGQKSIEVSEPGIEVRGNRVLISYSILRSTPDDLFRIALEIKEENGNTIDARTLWGDIGDSISGGGQKQIIWDLEEDNIFLDTYILVKIKAWVLEPPSTPKPDEKEAPKEELIADTQEIPSDLKTFNRTGLVFQSLAFPGLGMSRAKGGPHWLRGVAGYGCLASSIVLNRQAINTLNSIEDLFRYDDIQSTYQKALKQNNTSEILAYAAIGIWVADFIWTLAGTKEYKRPAMTAQYAGLFLGTSIDPISKAPMFQIRYNF